MNAPVLWSVFPALAAFALYSLRRWERMVHIASGLIALLLAALAWGLPLNQPINLGLGLSLLALRIGDTWVLLGTRFITQNSDRPVLVLFYISAAFWTGGAYFARTHRVFVPASLGIAALLSAALTSSSIPVTILLLELAVLLCIPVLSQPGDPTRRGALRFLIFQTLGGALILFANTALNALLSSTTEPARLLPAAFIMALGFALVIGVVPFHTWMPMLAEETHPYAASYVFFLLPTAVAILAIDILLHASPSGAITAGIPGLFAILQYGGVLMVLAGGAGAAFDRHLGRILGFAAISQIGNTLLAASLNDQPGRLTPLISILFIQLVPQALGLAIWALALSSLRAHHPELRFRHVQGAMRRLTLICSALVLAQFSLAGMPLLASFPVYFTLWSQLALRSLALALATLAGTTGLFVAGLRTLAVLLQAPEDEPWRIAARGLQVILLGGGIFLLLFAGLFPQIYIPTLTRMAILFGGE